MTAKANTRRAPSTSGKLIAACSAGTTLIASIHEQGPTPDYPNQTTWRVIIWTQKGNCANTGRSFSTKTQSETFVEGIDMGARLFGGRVIYLPGNDPWYASVGITLESYK